MITAIVLYDLPPHIDREACRQHFLKIAPGLPRRAGLHPQAVHLRRGRAARRAVRYIWEDLASAKAFYNGPWLDGHPRSAMAASRASVYFDTFAIADQATGYAGAPRVPQKALA